MTDAITMETLQELQEKTAKLEAKYNALPNGEPGSKAQVLKDLAWKPYWAARNEYNNALDAYGAARASMNKQRNKDTPPMTEEMKTGPDHDPLWRPTDEEVHEALRQWYAHTEYDEEKCRIAGSTIDTLRRRIIGLKEEAKKQNPTP